MKIREAVTGIIFAFMVFSWVMISIEKSIEGEPAPYATEQVERV